MSERIEEIVSELLRRGYKILRSPERVEAKKGDVRVIFYPELGGFMVMRYEGPSVFGKAFASFDSLDKLMELLGEE